MRAWLALPLAAMSGCTCGGEALPPIETDGNVIVGDATPGGAPDAEPEAGPEAGPRDREISVGAEMDAEVDSGLVADTAVPDNGCNIPVQAVLTSSEAIAGIDLWANKIVEVTGTSTSGPLGCTSNPGNPDRCMEACSATVSIDGLIPIRSSECFPSAGCSGPRCAQVCKPPVLGVPQAFSGRLIRAGQGSGVALELYMVNE